MLYQSNVHGPGGAAVVRSGGQCAAQNEPNQFGELVVRVERFGVSADPTFQGLEVACGQ
jgi:hypothetical protein